MAVDKRIAVKWSRRIGSFAAMFALGVGCTTVAQVTTLDDPACKTTVREQMNSILLEEGEKSEIAERLAVNTTTVLAAGVLGPRPFGVSSPSGVDYSFFVQLKGSECRLLLYGRQKGFTRYTNNLTYIATRSLDGCQCAE
jgi:hypothetical protein